MTDSLPKTIDVHIDKNDYAAITKLADEWGLSISETSLFILKLYLQNNNSSENL